jgi:hypothetical protein
MNSAQSNDIPQNRSDMNAYADVKTTVIQAILTCTKNDVGRHVD